MLFTRCQGRGMVLGRHQVLQNDRGNATDETPDWRDRQIGERLDGEGRDKPEKVVGLF